jgi:pimeloyl-ACP methyl ester carboxylesterase
MTSTEVPYRIDGADDAPPLVLSNSLGSTIAAHIPRARLERVDAAHPANHERPDEVTALILSHLEAT